MAWFVRILTAVLPYLIKYGPAAVDAARELLNILTGEQSARGVKAPTKHEAQREALADAIVQSLEAEAKKP